MDNTVEDKAATDVENDQPISTEEDSADDDEGEEPTSDEEEDEDEPSENEDAVSSDEEVENDPTEDAEEPAENEGEGCSYNRQLYGSISFSYPLVIAMLFMLVDNLITNYH